ncbi:ATP-binding protein [Nocardia sp. NPDC020380]|uniref:sensor histidine kinase n=1 Tax=Nocardia sp. NPDC020380 TaxID=3364309 RepID=UPI0037AB331E
MEAAPRSWQFSLSNWPVTRKVGIVLVLPVLLAATFAVLRINSELQTIAKLSAATEQSDVLRPTVKFVIAADELAVQAAAAGNQDSDPALDTATTQFDQAVAEMDAALKSSSAEPAVTKEMAQAVDAARSMKNSLRSSSPESLGDQAGEIQTRVQNALANAPTISEQGAQQSFLQFGSILTCYRLLTQERIMLAVPAVANNPGMRTRLLTAIGAEATMIEVYRGLSPAQAVNANTLRDNAQARIGILMQNMPDPGNLPAMQDSLNNSMQAYQKEVVTVAGSMDSALSKLTTDARNNVLRDTSIVIGMLLAGLAIALMVARSLVVPVRRLRRDALQVAHIDLPQELEVVRTGGATPEISPVDVHTTEEIGQLARAVDDIHAQALHLAADQARLRLQIGNMFETLSRRSQSLVEQQLSLIEELERDEDDSERLQSLFRLDHLATRMRRNGDNLLVLAGTALRRGHLAPVPLSDMLWSSVSQVEDYQRVEIGTVPDGIVSGEPAVDIEHLLAELIDNALRYSPPSTPVAVSVARAVDGGYLIEITDRGLGMNAEDLQGINDRLASGGEVNVETARRMGLFVVGRLAKRHHITVSLRRTSAMVQQPGITSSVHLPGSLVSPSTERSGEPTGQYPLSGPLPAAPLTGPQSLVSTPVVTPPRLIPVPNPPEPANATGRFVTNSGLPQRKAPGDTGEQPIVAANPQADRFSDGFTDAFTEPADARAYSVSGPRPEPVAPQPPASPWGHRTETGAPAPSSHRGEGDNGPDTGTYFGNGYSAFGDHSSAAAAKRDDTEPDYAETGGYDDSATGRFDDNAGDFTDLGATGEHDGGYGDYADNRGGFDERGDGFDDSNVEFEHRTTRFEPQSGGYDDRTSRFADRSAGFSDRSAEFGDRTGAYAEHAPGFAEPTAAFTEPAAEFTEPAATYTEPAAYIEQPAPQFTERTPGYTERTGFSGRTPEFGNDTVDFGRVDLGSSSAPAEPEPAEPQRSAPTQTGLRPVGEAPTPIFQRMVSEWLVEPAAAEEPDDEWTSSSDAGWAAAEEAANPSNSGRTQGGLPIRRPGAQLVPGAVAQEDEGGARNPDEIRSSLTRHLSGVRSGRADSQYNDGGHV